MDDSAPWKTEETIIGLPQLPVLSDYPDLVAVTFSHLCHLFTPGMDDSAPWKTEETIIGFPKLPAYIWIWWLSPFHTWIWWLSPFHTLSPSPYGTLLSPFGGPRDPILNPQAPQDRGRSNAWPARPHGARSCQIRPRRTSPRAISASMSCRKAFIREMANVEGLISWP